MAEGTPPCGAAPPGSTQSHDVSHPQVEDTQHRCIIHDALRGMRHVVQLRAQEEFGLGMWSEWSRQVTGTPWTGTLMGVEGGWEVSALLWNKSPQS